MKKYGQGINWDIIKKHAESRGEKVKFLENEPQLSEACIDEWEAFILLSATSKNINKRIDFNAIVNYMNEYEIQDRKEFIYIITELDLHTWRKNNG